MKKEINILKDKIINNLDTKTNEIKGNIEIKETEILNNNFKEIKQQISDLNNFINLIFFYF